MTDELKRRLAADPGLVVRRSQVPHLWDLALTSPDAFESGAWRNRLIDALTNHSEASLLEAHVRLTALTAPDRPVVDLRQLEVWSQLVVALLKGAEAPSDSAAVSTHKIALAASLGEALRNRDLVTHVTPGQRKATLRLLARALVACDPVQGLCLIAQWLEDDSTRSWGEYSLAHLSKLPGNNDHEASDAITELKGRLARSQSSCRDPQALQTLALFERDFNRERQLRGGEDEPAGAIALPEGLRLSLTCREGLSPLLERELKRVAQNSLACVVPSPDAVVVTCKHATTDHLFASRIWEAVELSLPASHVKEVSAPDAQAAHIWDMLRTADLEKLIAAELSGALSFRLRRSGAGSHASKIKALARSLELASGGRLKNDTRRAQAHLGLTKDKLRCELTLWADRRFRYRQYFHEASSDPSLAAALVLLADPKAGEVALDPFCGSGTELVELHTFEPSLSLFGIDSDERALALAKATVTAAHVPAHLSLGDARTLPAETYDVIVTNPPFGRRSAFGEAHLILAEFLRSASKTLRTGGRLAWVNPMTRRSDEEGWHVHAGLHLEKRYRINLGGIVVSLELLTKGVKHSK